MQNCMGCPKHSELLSLRAQVKRFENGREISNLQSDLDKTNRKLQSVTKENDCLKAENKQLRNDNRFLKTENERISELNEILVNKCRDFQDEEDTANIYQSDRFASVIDNLVISLAEENEALQQKVKDLAFDNQHMKALLNTDGTNSGTPSSQTPKNKDKVRPNSRNKTGKPRGGVEGHVKSRLSKHSDDEINDTVDHPIEGNCSKCNGTLEDTGKTIDKDETEIEVRTIKRRHRYQIYRCSCCGKEVHMPIPNNLKEENQYGVSVQAVATSLMNSCNVPINKTGEFISGLTNGEVKPCNGYLAKLQKRNALNLEQFMKDLKCLLVVRAILYWDDTVIMIDKSRGCLRFYGDEKIAFYVAHLHKDLEGVMQDEILQNLREETKVMHDHCSINYNKAFVFQNLECNAHLIRDLQKVFQILGHSWADDLHKHISGMIHDRKVAIDAGLKEFGETVIQQFFDKVHELITIGREQCRKDRSQYYGNEEFTLLNRIEEYMDNYFMWVKDFSLPTTDSLSERALRIVKSKQKISGQFFSEETANYYATIKSYIETCRRNGINEFNALKRLSEGNPYTVQEIFKLDNK